MTVFHRLRIEQHICILLPVRAQWRRLGLYRLLAPLPSSLSNKIHLLRNNVRLLVLLVRLELIAHRGFPCSCARSCGGIASLAGSVAA